MNERMYRSREDRIIAGVAGGVAEQLNIDPSIVRILWVILTPLTGGLALLLYFVMAIVVPLEPMGGPMFTAPPMMPPAGATPTGTDAAAAGATPGWPASSAEPGTTPGWPASSPETTASGDWWTMRHEERQARRAARRAARAEHRDPTGALILGLILIVVGGYFLVRAYIPAIDADRAWPVLIVLLGAVLLVGSIRRSPGPSA